MERSDSGWIEISLHASQRMEERGASFDEVQATVRQGERETAREGKRLYRKRFPFRGQWRGSEYQEKEVAVVVAEEPDRQVVVTVYVFYLAAGGGP